jgi:RNA polymerase sigma-70 factor (sigma-E family)
MTARVDPVAAPEADPASAPDVETVYREAWSRLVRLGYVLSGSTAAAEDLAQEAFVGLLRHRDGVENVQAYLRRSIVNLHLNAKRRGIRERSHLSAIGPPVDVDPPVVDDLWALIRRLPDRQRAVLALRYYEDLPEREIADVLGCRPGTVKSLASRALDVLRKDLADD